MSEVFASFQKAEPEITLNRLQVPSVEVDLNSSQALSVYS